MNRSNKTYTNINLLLTSHKKIIELNNNLSKMFDFNKKPIRKSKTCPILNM